MIQVAVAGVAASSKRSSSPAIFVVSYQTSNVKCARVSYYFVIWYVIFYSKYIRAYPPVLGQYMQYTTTVVQQYTPVYFCTSVTAVSYVWYALYRTICTWYVLRMSFKCTRAPGTKQVLLLWFVVGSTAVYRPQYTLLGICIVLVLYHTNSIICTFDMHLICTGMPFKLACVPKNMLNRSTEESAAQLDALSRMGMVVCSPWDDARGR